MATPEADDAPLPVGDLRDELAHVAVKVDRLLTLTAALDADAELPSCRSSARRIREELTAIERALIARYADRDRPSPL